MPTLRTPLQHLYLFFKYTQTSSSSSSRSSLFIYVLFIYLFIIYLFLIIIVCNVGADLLFTPRLERACALRYQCACAFLWYWNCIPLG